MSKIVVVVPTYNELENLPLLVKALFDLPLPTLEVLFVDDNSPDGTGKRADEFAATDSRVHVMHRAGKQGLGTAYVQGFKWAIQHGADLVIQMDADFSHSPTAIPSLVEKAQDYDAV